MTDSCLSFLILPALTSACFSALMRSSNTEAGSSFGSCGTSFPCTASCSIDFFNSSGKELSNDVIAFSEIAYKSIYCSTHRIL